MRSAARQWHRLRTALGMLARGQGARLLYELQNRRRGLDLHFVSVEQLGLPAARAHWYSDSGGPELAGVLASLRIPRGSVALDLGCGKGGAAITLARHFTRVTGVELAAELVDIARRNAQRSGLDNLRFVHSDASAFTALDDYTHLYLYNPFPCAVLAEVLANLRASLVRHDRELVLIYRNPVCADTVAASGLFARERELKPGEHWWYIYRHSAGYGSGTAAPAER